MHSILFKPLYHHGVLLTSYDVTNFTFFTKPPAGGCSTNFAEAISELIKFTQIYESKWNKKNIRRGKYFLHIFSRLFLLWREKDFNAEKLGFSFHETYHESTGPLDKLFFRLLIAAFAVEYFCTEFFGSSTRADCESRSSNILWRLEKKVNKIWVEFGSWTEVAGRSRRALCQRNDRTWSDSDVLERPHEETQQRVEERTETRCICSRFNPHTKDRASQDKKQSRMFPAKFWPFGDADCSARTGTKAR